MAGGQILSGRILAKSLLPEPKSSLKCSITSLVLVTNQKFRGKKFTFSNSLRGSLWKLITHHHCRGMWGELPQACAPGTKGRRDDVILTGLDEESDSTNEEMPPLEPLEPLEGAAQLGEVWLCGHERRM